MLRVVSGLEAVAVAASLRVEVDRWRAEFDSVFARVAGRFAQVQSRLRARGYLLGLLSQSERKNGWTIAEFAGDADPQGMQRLLGHYRWDVDAARDDLRGYVAERLGDDRAVLVVDETGFVKKGRWSAGVQRQYTGTSGKIDNCQLGVFLGYASVHGRALVDRELYLPESWTSDRDRCRQAGIGDGVGFATKPELARRMVERAVDAAVPFAWVARRRWPSWSGWPDPAGRSRNASSRPRTRSAWTTTRSAGMRPGTGTSPWRCSRTPSWPASPPGTARERGTRRLWTTHRPLRDHEPGEELIPLTINEIRRRFATLTRPDHPIDHTLAWSRRRRRHQANARHWHYQRRLKHHGLMLQY
jgi:DDE superfamily endonuclease